MAIESTTKNVNIKGKNVNFNAPIISSLKAIVNIDGGIEKKVSGI